MRVGSQAVMTDDDGEVRREVMSGGVIRMAGRGHAHRDELPLPSDRRFATRLRAVVALQAAEPPFTVAEIADVLDVSERQVWRLMSRVRSYRARAAGRV
jgi:hypothetical protein